MRRTGFRAPSSQCKRAIPRHRATLFSRKERTRRESTRHSRGILTLPAHSQVQLGTRMPNGHRCQRITRSCSKSGSLLLAGQIETQNLTENYLSESSSAPLITSRHRSASHCAKLHRPAICAATTSGEAHHPIFLVGGLTVVTHIRSPAPLVSRTDRILKLSRPGRTLQNHYQHDIKIHSFPPEYHLRAAESSARTLSLCSETSWSRQLDLLRDVRFVTEPRRTMRRPPSWTNRSAHANCIPGRVGGILRHMASRTLTTLVDDMDASSAADETVRFALDGTDYEIDLKAVHAVELRSAFNMYIGAARRVRGRYLRGE